jgi:anaerobic magnesium-protoporphyrin IX monomethyl ester cyclase
MRICLVFPKTTVFEDPMVFPPLGLFYIRAVLEQAGHEVEFIDMSDYNTVGKDRVELFPDVSSIPSGFDAYMVSGTSPQATEIRRIGAFLKGRGDLVIAGGPHVTNYAGPETLLEKGTPDIYDLPVDPELIANYHVLVKNEGEGAVLRALELTDHARRAMDRDGSPVPLETIPIPNRDAAKRYHYALDDEYGRGRRGTTMFSSRGCPERCAFCDSPGLWGRAVRYIPMESIVAEFRQIKRLGYDAIQFYDDILPLHKGRMLEMCDELKKHGFIWRCFFRVDIMSHPNYGREFIQRMYDTGLREALVGVESGSQRMLDGIHKGTTVEQNTLVRSWCRDIGVRFKASVILGLPGETMESMEATRKWVLDNRPDRVNICTFIPFTGTPISKSTEEARKREYGTDALHEYDIHWEMDAALLEQEFYAGSRTKLKSMVSTSALTADQITDFYHSFVADVEKLGIPY